MVTSVQRTIRHPVRKHEGSPCQHKDHVFGRVRDSQDGLLNLYAAPPTFSIQAKPLAVNMGGICSLRESAGCTRYHDYLLLLSVSWIRRLINRMGIHLLRPAIESVDFFQESMSPIICWSSTGWRSTCQAAIALCRHYLWVHKLTRVVLVVSA